MSKFMVLYRAQASAREQMANATPEQMRAGLEAWRVWATKVDYAIVDLGSPLAHTTHVGAGAASTDGVAGATHDQRAIAHKRPGQQVGEDHAL